jgi:diguanylate cyclase (GGDEF)-like protein/PAS domain S-box-containing protein
VSDELAEALAGETAVELSPGASAESATEVGLADHLLEIYLPIHSPATGDVIGAYEIYEDGGPIAAQVDVTRRDVFLIAGGMALAMLLLLYIAFSGSARRLAAQNRALRRMAVDAQASEARFRSLVQNSSDIFVVVDAGGGVLYESVAVERVLGYPAGERHSAYDSVHSDDLTRARKFMHDVTAAPGVEISAEFRVRHADKTWRVLEWTGKDLSADAAVRGIVINSRDVSERKSLEDALTHQAFHDTLTGLANRALFIDRVTHALARSARQPRRLAVLFLDLDDFKTVNDTLGHAAGDRLLREIARRITAELRSGDTAARLSGDEFAVLIEDLQGDDVAALTATRVLAAVGIPLTIEGHELRMTGSIGIALGHGTAETADDLLIEADVAMYHAKESGKARHATFEPQMRLLAWSRLELEAELRRALDRGELTVHYQPVLDLATRQLVDVEALVRWQHPVRGLLPPAAFITVAERAGLIGPLGLFVLREACQQVREWQRLPAASGLSVSVNLSPHQFRDPALVDQIRAVLTDTGLDARSLKLEITESSMMADGDATEDALRALHELGVRLVVDDFGTGYSALNYFKRFKLDELKIDRTFVAGLGRDREHTAIVKAAVAFAKALGLGITAEGIETDNQLARLIQLGCNRGQGFLFSKPLSAESFGGLLVEMPAFRAAA